MNRCCINICIEKSIAIEKLFLVSKNDSTMTQEEGIISLPPIAQQKDHKVVFVSVDGEDRGQNPFKQQRYLDDPWFWLRDESRENKEVLKHLYK